jgi:hypothetical protein
MPEGATTKAIELLNDTPNLIQVSLGGQFGQFLMSPYVSRYKNVPGFGNGTINVTSIAQMVGAGQAPINLLSIISYGPEDPDQLDYTISHGFLSSIGNAATLATSASTVINDNNATPVNVVESTPTGSTGSTLVERNDGLVLFAEYVASVYTKLFQVIPGAAIPVLLGAVGRGVEALGNLTVDGNLSVTGTGSIGGILTASNTSNSVFASKLGGGVNLPGFGLGGINPLDILDATGIANTKIKCGPGGALIMNDNVSDKWSLSTWSHGSSNQGSNTDVVITHGLNINGVATAPTIVLTGTANTVNTSQVVNTFNYTSTTFTIHNGTGVSQIIRWLAIIF